MTSKTISKLLFKSEIKNSYLVPEVKMWKTLKNVIFVSVV